MNEKPILFSGPMVRALLEGRKTQTRRAVKPQPLLVGKAWTWPEDHPNSSASWREGVGPSLCMSRFCPYGQPGDHLWVRETFFHQDDFHGKDVTWYRADNDTFPGMWKPSIFMPKKLSRITLEITGVRVERVRDISEEDAKAEGIRAYQSIVDGRCLFTCRENDTRPGKESAGESYRELWDSINAKRTGCAWKDNPWVWCLSFRMVAPRVSR